MVLYGRDAVMKEFAELLKNWRSKRRRSWDLKQSLWLGSRELIAFVSFFLLKSWASKNYIYNHKIMGPYIIYQVVIFMKRKENSFAVF